MVNRMMWIAWPAFLAACVLELVVFALVDPHDLRGMAQWSGGSREAVYTAAFFVFWIVVMGACALTALLRLSPAEVNQCPFEPGQRPSGCPGESGVLPS